MNAAFNAPRLNTVKSLGPSHRCTSNRENDISQVVNETVKKVSTAQSKTQLDTP